MSCLYQRNLRRDLLLATRKGPFTPVPGRGFLALTFGTLLSSQGSGAHQDRAFRPSLGATALTYLGGLRVSNSFPAPPPPRATLSRDRGRGVCHAWWPPRERPPSGVRHSLPGDVENIRQSVCASANRLVSGLQDRLSRTPGPRRGCRSGSRRARGRLASVRP